MEENVELPEADCGCGDKKQKQRAALEKGRAARGKKKPGHEVFKDTIRDLACRCRDAFGHCYPCSGESS